MVDEDITLVLWTLSNINLCIKLICDSSLLIASLMFQK